MSHVVLGHYQNAPWDQIFVCVLQKLVGVFDSAEDIGTEEAAKLSQLWKVAGISNHKLHSIPVL